MAWISGKVLVLIKLITLCWAQIVHGWVGGKIIILVYNWPPNN